MAAFATSKWAGRTCRCRWSFAPAKGWSRNGRLNPARPAVVSTKGGTKHWQGTIELERRQILSLRNEPAARCPIGRDRLKVVAGADLDVEGVYFGAQLPVTCSSAARPAYG